MLQLELATSAAEESASRRASHSGMTTPKSPKASPRHPAPAPLALPSIPSSPATEAAQITASAVQEQVQASKPRAASLLPSPETSRRASSRLARASTAAALDLSHVTGPARGTLTPRDRSLSPVGLEGLGSISRQV